MAEVTYYFNAYDTEVTEWATDPAKMVDGVTTNYASTNDANDIQLLTENTCPGTNLGTITKVEIRAFNYISGTCRNKLTPVFVGGDGDEENTDAGFAGAWSDYYDITNDTNAPAWNSWADVQNLDCKIQAEINAGWCWCGKIEIRVTYVDTYTSKATGNWDAEGQSTWNEAGHPIAGHTVTIQNGHTVTLDSAAACENLTINTGGVLTDATNNQGLTVSKLTKVSGTLTCGTANMSFGSGETTVIPKLEIKAGGTFNGGSGNHIIGALESDTATSTCNMTSGTCTLNGSAQHAVAHYQLGISSDSTFAHNNGTIILTYPYHIFVDTHSLYNLTINHSGQTHCESNITIANNLTITSGTLAMDDDDGVSFNLSVGGVTSITGILDGQAGTLNFDGNITINGAGTLVSTTGTLSFAGATWTNDGGTFTHSSGTVVFDGTNQAIVGSNTWHHFTKSVTTARTFTIDNTSTQTFEKNLTLNGVSGQLLSIISDSAGDAFNFTMTAAAVKTSLTYLSVKDSDASGSDASHKPIEPTNSTDVSGNTDWFSAPAPPASSGSSAFHSKRIINL